MICKFKPTHYVHAANPSLRYHRCSRAECGKGVFLPRGGRAGRVQCNHPSIGAGDAVAAITKAAGIVPGPNCQCEHRRRMMNAYLPSLRKPWIVSWYQGKVASGMPPACTFSPRGALAGIFLVASFFASATRKSM